MEGSFLRVYMHEGERHHGQLAWEWLLEQANELGISGGSAFRAMAGFGRHHKLSEAKFFQLRGSVAVEVEFIVTDREAQQLLALRNTERRCHPSTRTCRPTLAEPICKRRIHRQSTRA